MCHGGPGQFGFTLKMIFLPNILGSILQSESFPSLGNINVKNMSCDKCGLTYNQFVKSGRLGCDKCYAILEKDLILS